MFPNPEHNYFELMRLLLFHQIGVLIVLGLGTAIRLGLECCHELGTQTTVQRVDFSISPGYPAAV
jgi:hypothetical protein